MSQHNMSSPVAEWSVLGSMLHRPEVIGEVIGTQLAASDFTDNATRIVYTTAVDRFYSSTPVDPVTVAEAARTDLAASWGIDQSRVAEKLADLASNGPYIEHVLDHANIVKRLSTTRQLQSVAYEAAIACGDGKLTPAEIGDRMSTEALQITSGGQRREEIMSWMDTGRAYVKQLQRVLKARSQGIETAVYTGLDFIDEWTMGIGPGELCFMAGDPGAGKSSIAWEASKGFSTRQLVKPAEHRVGTMIASLEMGTYPTGMRMAQAMTGIDGSRLRSGDITQDEYKHILAEWKNRETLPLYFNFASNFRLSQLRALVVEGIRRHNVGFLVIDHFRMLDPDKPVENGVREDEIKVRFLKESLAKDLNIAVLCLAHTIKVGRGAEGGSRPRLSDLRGSGQISAAADFVGFVHRPWKHAGEEAQMELGLRETDAELVWAKNRFGTESVAEFSFEPRYMKIGPRGAV